MKAVIAAAGKGTRMKELGYDRPKHLIEVLDRPFLFFLLDNLKEAGYDEIIIVGGYKLEIMKKFLKEYDPNIKVISQFEEMGIEKYGTIVPLLAAKDYLENEEFIFVSGDNYYCKNDLKSLKKLNDVDYVASVKNDNPENYGVILKDKENYLEKIVEKPEKFISNDISIGLYKFQADIFDKLKDVKKSKRGEYEITDAINSLAKEHKVKVVDFKGHWFDFGKPEDIPVLEEFLKEEQKHDCNK